MNEKVITSYTDYREYEEALNPLIGPGLEEYRRTRGPAPIFNKLGDIKQSDGFSYILFVFTGAAGNCYMLMRKETGSS
jgi:hypothetical protein